MGNARISARSATRQGETSGGERVKIEYGTSPVTLLGNTAQESESGFTGSVERIIQTVQPIRAALAVRYDRSNAAYTFDCQATIGYASLTAAEIAMLTHMATVIAKGKATVTFTLSDGKQYTMANSLVTPRLIGRYGVAVNWGYSITGETPTVV